MKNIVKKAAALIVVACCLITAVGAVPIFADDSLQIRIECESAECTALKPNGDDLEVLKTDSSLIFFSYNNSRPNTRLEVGDKVSYKVNAETAGTYSLSVAFRQNDNYYSTVQASVNGENIGDPFCTAGDPTNGNDDNKVFTYAVGEVELPAGESTITLEITGAAADSNKTQLVLDYINFTAIIDESGTGIIRVECESADYTAVKAGGGELKMLKKDSALIFFSYDKKSDDTLVGIGDSISYTVIAESGGTYELAVAYRLNDNYFSSFQVSVNGVRVGSPLSTAGDPQNAGDDNTVVSSVAGKAELSAGENVVTLEIVGSATVANQTQLVLDNIVLTPSETDFEFSAVSVTLQSSLAMNFKIRQSLVEALGYTDLYVVFSFNGKEYKVDQYTINGGNYVFSFKNIAPDKLGDKVAAVLYASDAGEEVTGGSASLSVSDYCMSLLANTGNAKLKSLLVDLLNYGAQSQLYTNYKTDELANASLTVDQQSFASSGSPEYVNNSNPGYTGISDPGVSFTGAGLRLVDSVTIRFKLSAADVQGLTVRITDDNGGEWSFAESDLVPASDGYYLYFNSLAADRMRDIIYLTVYSGEEPVSNTLSYSIVSYAYTVRSLNDPANGSLEALLEAMIRYGDSAYAYTH